MSEQRSRARQPWRNVARQRWLKIGTKVHDAFGDWWIVSLPSQESTFGYAQIEIASERDGAPERHIWLNEFLQEFTPVV